MESGVQSIVNDLVDSYNTHKSIVKINSMTQPNREVIVGILDDLQKLIFPGFFEPKHLKTETIHYYVGELLENIRYNLRKQITNFKNPYRNNRSVYANAQSHKIAPMVQVEV